MRAPITDKHLLEMMWERFPEIMKRGTEQPAQQEPEYIVQSNGRYSPLLTHMMNKRVKSNVKQVIELYDSPEQPAQQQEPFGHVTVRRLSQRFENHHDTYHFYPAGQSPYLDNVDECHTVYTSPPASKPWVGLTDEEIENIFNNWPTYHLDHEEFARVIENILREKNS